MLRWIPRCADPEGPTLMDRLLRARGFETREAAEAFLSPSRAQLGDPLGMPGMDEAVKRIHAAKAEARAVVIYGDYDVDGVTATALLTLFLAEFGVRARHYIPSRHREGYGLNAEALRSIAADGEQPLLITVDCGVTAVAEIALAKELGLDPIVTDHHRPGEALPDCPVLNPLLGYPFPALCGAGVAFKLCQALDDDLAFQFIDLAALGTVADVVPLTDENRAITALGIARMNADPRPGIAALMEVSGVKAGEVTAGRIAFQLAPRLNAGGRVGDAIRSLNLLTARTMAEAAPLASELNDENNHRKALEGEILSGAAKQLEGFDFAARRAIILADEGWNTGVLGLAASRLVEKYNLPVVLLRREDGVLHGSCRSIPGVDIHQALSAVGHLLTRFGGHSQAAGLSLPEENFPEFARALDGVIARGADPECFVPAARYDMALPLSLLDEGFVRLLEKFEPTGFGNPSPVFLTGASVSEARAVGAEGAHLKLRLADGGRGMPAIAFSMGGRAGALPERARALYAPRIGAYGGREYVECQVRALEDAGYSGRIRPGSFDFAALFQTFLTNRLYNKAYSIEASGAFGGFDGIFSCLNAEPRGTLVLAATPDAAAEFLSAAESHAPDRMDVYVGSQPTDPRAFNAFCLLPPGEPPEGYERIFSLDAPAALWGYPVIEPETPPPSRLLFPDVDELRAIYILARDFASRPTAARSFRAILRDLARETELSEACVYAGLTILDDMNLIALSDVHPWLSPRPPRKADPKANPMFLWLRQLSGWGGEPLGT